LKHAYTFIADLRRKADLPPGGTTADLKEDH
jgi:hypothetical protein